MSGGHARAPARAPCVPAKWHLAIYDLASVNLLVLVQRCAGLDHGGGQDTPLVAHHLSLPQPCPHQIPAPLPGFPLAFLSPLPAPQSLPLAALGGVGRLDPPSLLCAVRAAYLDPHPRAPGSVHAVLADNLATVGEWGRSGAGGVR